MATQQHFGGASLGYAHQPHQHNQPHLPHLRKQPNHSTHPVPSTHPTSPNQPTHPASSLRTAIVQHSTPIVFTRSLPGPMSVTRMSSSGVLFAFDSASAYLGEPADTLHGRGVICRQTSPAKVVACASLAAWIWVGGDFPSTIDVVSDSHYRSTMHGRRIRPFNRRIDRRHITTIGGMPVTKPVRTACDIALIVAVDKLDLPDAHDTIRRLMNQYCFGADECLETLEQDSRHWPNIRQARLMLTNVADELGLDTDSDSDSSEE